MASGTNLVFDHTCLPEDNQEHLDAEWVSNYSEPLKKHLA
jgi:hypothetical protein